MSIIGIIAIAFTFGVAILAHEFGHFIFAKLLGVGVETFSIGMGKKIIKIKRGETTYCLSAIPFGGYVVMKGALSKEMEAQLRENEEKSKEKKEEGEKNKKSLPELVSDDILSLRNKSLPVKVAIYASGVFMNFVVAIITFTAIMVIGMDVPEPKPPIVGFVAPASVPERLDIKQGDRVKAVNGKPVKNFDEIYERLGVLINTKATTLTITLERGEKTFNVGVPLNIKSPKFLEFMRNFNPPLEPYIEEVMYNQPADRANIMPGDYVLEVNDKPINDWMQMVVTIRSSVGKPVRLKIRRGNQYLFKVVTPVSRPEEPEVGQLGIIRGEPKTVLKRLPVVEAVGESFTISYQIMGFVVVNTYKLFSRFNVHEMGENLGGPVAIAIESYRQAKSGLRNYFYFFGAFNIMLLMLNILPLPILDGGHILFSTIESIFRKPIPAKTLLHIYSIMIIILIALALLVTYNDIVRNFWRLGFP